MMAGTGVQLVMLMRARQAGRWPWRAAVNTTLLWQKVRPFSAPAVEMATSTGTEKASTPSTRSPNVFIWQDRTLDCAVAISMGSGSSDGT